MANKVTKIGVMTSGGDSPGMNAAIRAVVRTQREHRRENPDLRWRSMQFHKYEYIFGKFHLAEFILRKVRSCTIWAGRLSAARGTAPYPVA